jgi:two-component system, OmpR family, sensor kinase
MLDTVRTRLTLWYIGVLALALIVFSIGVYAMMARKLGGRLDTGLQTAMEGTARLFEHEKEEGETDQHAAESALRKYYYPRQAVAVFDHAGGLLKEQALGDVHATLPASVASLDRDGLQFYMLPESQTGVDDGLHLVVQRIRTSPQSAVFIVISQPFGDASNDAELLAGVLGAAVPLALILAAAGGWFLARKSLAPVVIMSERARRISAENLGERLPIINPRDELGQLAATFNELLSRLDDAFARQQEAFAQQRQFMADASHELRTPLSVIRATSEVTLDEPDCEAGEYREAMVTVGEQARRLTRIVEDLFTLARADAGQREIERKSFYLDELVTETARAASVLASRKGVVMEYAPALESPFHGDEGLLRQMILNLLDNAIKHTPAGGSVRLSLDRRDSKYAITVADTGAGVPAEAQPHIFSRFYRADKTRSRSGAADGGGAGLGLSIAKWIAEAHDGRLELAHSDETGSAFIVSFPLSDAC